ncbi:RES domain-containing protein [Acidihalobacter prosperus]|nr:RES domain-containing protein [Acidihalobacter prosperus]
MRLEAPPCDAHEARVSSITDYTDAQRLGNAMRHSGVEASRYVSARDPARGRNLVMFAPDTFSAPSPRDLRGWHCTTTSDRVIFVAAHCDDGRQFERDLFEVDVGLPAPAP